MKGLKKEAMLTIGDKKSLDDRKITNWPFNVWMRQAEVGNATRSSLLFF